MWKRKLIDDTDEASFVLKMMRLALNSMQAPRRVLMLNVMLGTYSKRTPAEAYALTKRANEIMAFMGFDSVIQTTFIQHARIYPAHVAGWSLWQRSARFSVMTAESLLAIFQANGATCSHFLATLKQPLVCAPMAPMHPVISASIVAMTVAMYEMGVLTKGVSTWAHVCTKNLVYNKKTMHIDYILYVMDKAVGAKVDGDEFIGAVANENPNAPYTRDMVQCFLAGHLYKQTKEGIAKLASDLVMAGGTILADTLSDGAYLNSDPAPAPNAVLEWHKGIRIVSPEGRGYFPLACDMEAWMRKQDIWNTNDMFEGSKDLTFESIFTGGE